MHASLCPEEPKGQMHSAACQTEWNPCISFVDGGPREHLDSLRVSAENCSVSHPSAGFFASRYSPSYRLTHCFLLGVSLAIRLSRPSDIYVCQHVILRRNRGKLVKMTHGWPLACSNNLKISLQSSSYVHVTGSCGFWIGNLKKSCPVPIRYKLDC